MKIIIVTTFIVFFAIGTTCADDIDDLPKYTAHLGAEYQNKTVPEIMVLVNDNVKDMEDMMRAAAKRYVKEDLEFVAGVYESLINWTNTELPKALTEMNQMAERDRTMNWMEMGIALQLIRDLGEHEDKKRANTTFKVTDTADNLMKKFEEQKTFALKLVKIVADELMKKPDKKFWSDLHQSVYIFLVDGFKDIETGIKGLTNDSIRAKNLQVIVNDLQVLIRGTQFRAPPTGKPPVGAKVFNVANFKCPFA